MCRGPLLVRVVARTLRGSGGESGRISCERSRATAARVPLTWESQRTYRISSAAVCAGWLPAGRARAGLARLDGESPVDGKEGDQYAFSVPKSQCQGSKGL